MSTALLPNANHAPTKAPPDWFEKLQAEAVLTHGSAPAPSLRDERWRFANIKAVDFSAFVPATPVATDVSDDLIARSQGLPSAGGALVFGNDRLLKSTASAEAASKGAVFLPLSDALRKHGELIRSYFMREASSLGAPKFAALHKSLMRNGTFLHVPKNVKLELPLQAFHWLEGTHQAIFPHTLIIAEEGSGVTLVDWFRSADNARSIACGFSDIWLGKGAEVRYVAVQDWNRDTTSIQSCNTFVSSQAAAKTLGLNFGGNYSRTEGLTRLTGTGAKSEMLSLTVADSTQEFDQRTLQEHQSADTFSDLLFKNALYDKAKTIFAGLIRVDPNAHRTDAYQKVRNLLLSDQAESNSLPGLEILADQVRCSHGATTGEIEPEELFYLNSRGIPKKDSLRLITHGFLNEILDRLPDAQMRSHFQTLLSSRLLGH
jgi:Fe-S cluster assembly protein SufD